MADDLGDEGSLLVEDQTFAIVGEWVITAEISDAAFRVYSMLLRFGGTSGCRMPSRALLGRRLHRSVDSIDRALRELVSAGIVRIEHRHDGRQFRSNRYHVRTSGPAGTAPGGGSRRSAATPSAPRGGGREVAATPGRTSAARVAADVRHYPEVPTQTEPPPPARAKFERADDELLASCGITDLAALARRCMDARTALGLPASRWSSKCLAVAIKLAVVNRGWPASDVVPALLAVAADAESRSPVRVAEAGPWWDRALEPQEQPTDDLDELERRLDDLGGRRPAVQAQARSELSVEGQPLTRTSVTRRACDILDRQQAS
jgi:hypothetical protein